VDARTWAAQMLARLSLEQKVAQLLVPALPSGLANAHSAELRNAQRLARELGVGGFLVAPGAAPLETAAALNSLQQASELPLLFAADYDGLVGGVLRDPDAARAGSGTEGGTLFPGNMGLAATGQPLHAELAGRVAAREARAVGVRWLLGPVAGITRIAETSTEPGAFSDDAATVVRFAGAAVRGMASAQVLTTVRAFPARATAREAAAMPVLSGSLAALEAGELAVLRELVRLGGVDALMLGNTRVPALTGDSLTPLTLSRAVATDLLRKRLGFGGVIVTDRLDDPALRAVPGYGAGEVAVRALEAGADVLLAPLDAGVAQRAIIAAVRSGRLPYNRIDDSVRRLLIAKALTGLAGERGASLDSVFTVVAAPEHAIVAAEVAAQSIVLVRDSASLLPLDPRHVHSLALIAVAAPSAVRAGAALAAELRTTYGSGTTFERIDERTADAVIDAAVARAGVAQAVVLAVFEPDQPWSERGRVSRFAARIAQRLEAVNRRLVVVAFGDPVPAASLAADALLLAWQPRGPAAQVAAARALSGRSPIAGVLPIALPTGGRALRRPAADVQLRPARAPEVGMDPVALERIDGLLLGAIHQGASPGAAIAVGRHGRIVKLRGYGRIDYRQSYADVTDSTIYDLASLTKVIGTTSALGMLVERGVLDLDAPVGHYIPEWNTTPAKAGVTLRDLALHTSGLAAYGPLYQQLRGRDEYRHRIARMDLTYPPGTRTVYSDFGVILLGLIIEQVTGEPLDVFLQRELFEPLGMRDTGFNPLSWPYAQLELGGAAASAGMPPFVLNRIAPTEVDTLFRDRQLHGRVHDENAFAIGGVAGHAGLFSSARDLAVFAQLMLDQGYYGGRRLLDPETVASFTRRAHPESSRAIGWDTPGGDASSAGEFFSARSYGHTGFTGTSIWIDPERDLFLILLTNRVNPTRANQKHVPLRRAVADAVQQAVRDVEVAPREPFEFSTR
jgi:CubicO group peptidase (beta-lactamase class C family)/beta-glucosidase-like glycosyl hydrolase